MQEEETTEMEFQLKKLITWYSDLFEYHQWPFEHFRWVELSFALVAKNSSIPEEEIRDVIQKLDELDLLDLSALASITFTEGGKQFDKDDLTYKRISECLSEAEFSESEIRNSILVLHEAARSLEKNHGGKVQKYLRKYGQKMLDELSNEFSFSEMKEEDVRIAFSYWLQHVLNMPVNLPLKEIDEFCETCNGTTDDLIETADKLDLNLAVLDDMIKLSQEKSEEDSGLDED
jgi:hypothetical protein